MSTPEIVTLAQAVAAEIADSVFAYVPELDATQEGVTKIWVVPVSEGPTPLERGTPQIVRQIGVIWIRKVKTNSEIEDIFAAREAASKAVYHTRLAGQWCFGADMNPFYDIDRLREKVLAARLLLSFKSYGAIVAISGS
jgi:hypothetical protein